MAATRKIHSFFETTRADDDETSEGNPGNSNGHSVDVAPPVPEPEVEVAAESAAAEPAPRTWAGSSGVRSDARQPDGSS